MAVKVQIDGLEKGPFTTIGMGVFDGLHTGHQAIYNQCDTLLTFDPHPDIVLGKKTILNSISTIEELTYYVPNLLILHFNEGISKLNPTEFLNQVIATHIKPKKIVVGYDFKFGHKGMGTIELLEGWASDYGIIINVINPVKDSHGNPHKSGQIRQWLDTDVNQAIASLGHPYLIIGDVIKGDGRGRQLGYPTANLKVHPQKCIPKTGVYKGYMELDSKKYHGIIYIGNKPSFEGQTMSIEVHLFDFNKSIYGKRVAVHIESFIRGDQKFETADALIQQIEVDIKMCQS